MTSWYEGGAAPTRRAYIPADGLAKTSFIIDERIWAKAAAFANRMRQFKWYIIERALDEYMRRHANDKPSVEHRGHDGRRYKAAKAEAQTKHMRAA